LQALSAKSFSQFSNAVNAKRNWNFGKNFLSFSVFKMGGFSMIAIFLQMSLHLHSFIVNYVDFHFFISDSLLQKLW